MKLLFTLLTLLGIGSLLSLWWSGAFAEASGWAFWLAIAAIASLLLPALLLPVVVVRLPADYFVASPRELAQRRGILGWVWFGVRNLLGLGLLLAGVALLFLPGQGLLTMFAGLLLLDVPGKRRLELRIVRRPAIRTELDQLRHRHGRPPFEVGVD